MSTLDMTPILTVAVVFGAVFGSFYNVLIYRLPRGMSIVRPRSACTQCGKGIAWYDNIPVVSYLILRGACRHCRTRISRTYVMVELLSGALAFFSVWRYGASLEALWIYAFLSILLIITFIDWYHQIIPDPLSLGGVVLGWVGARFVLDITLLDSLIGSVVGAGLLLIVALLYKAIRKIDGLGGGDVKLMAMIGAFLGWQMVFPVLFLASFCGSLYGLYLIRGGGGGRTAVAFGSFLAPAAFVMLCFGPTLWDYYLRFYLG